MVERWLSAVEVLCSAGLVVLAVGCGATARDSDTTRGSEGHAADASNAEADQFAAARSAIAGVTLVDNVEHAGDRTLLDAQTWQTRWYTVDDLPNCDNPQPRGSVMPAPDEEFYATGYAASGVAPAPELAGQPSNDYGVRFRGTLHSLWGANVGFEGVNKQPANLAALGYVGVRFWGYAPAPELVRVKLEDRYSTPEAGLCKPQNDEPCDSQGCYASAFAEVQLAAAWREYRVYFSAPVTDDPNTLALELAFGERNKWGELLGAPETALPSVVDISAVYAVQFQTDAKQDFDFWIDNVGFIVAKDAPN